MKYKGCIIAIEVCRCHPPLYHAIITFPDHDTIGVYGRDEQDAKAKAKASINAWLRLQEQE